MRVRNGHPLPADTGKATQMLARGQTLSAVSVYRWRMAQFMGQHALLHYLPTLPRAAALTRADASSAVRRPADRCSATARLTQDT